MKFSTTLDINDYDYILSKASIAMYPSDKRDASKLLVFGFNQQPARKVVHTVFQNISSYIPRNSLLVVNSTKVIPARINLQKQTGGNVELLCIEPIAPSIDPQIAMMATCSCTWECIVGGRRVNEGMELQISDTSIRSIGINLFKAKIIKRYDNKAIVDFVWQPSEKSFAEMLNLLGKIPLPPYIKRDAADFDIERYQTVYASINGSVAAPTAGLHFSNEIMKELENKHIKTTNVVLHIGPGTFVPIEADIAHHKMHNEQIFVSKEAIEQLLSNYSLPNNFTIATGTTSLRTLETLYWWGVKVFYNPNMSCDNFYLEQAFPYTNAPDVSVDVAFRALLDYMNVQNINNLYGRTQLFIVPGYKIRTINALITNFHLPKSTLLLLVSAFIGTENCKNIYKEALQNDYKFLSYGDSSLLIKNIK